VFNPEIKMEIDRKAMVRDLCRVLVRVSVMVSPTIQTFLVINLTCYNDTKKNNINENNIKKSERVRWELASVQVSSGELHPF